VGNIKIIKIAKIRYDVIINVAIIMYSISYTWLDTNMNLLYLSTNPSAKKGKREKNIYIIIIIRINE